MEKPVKAHQKNTEAETFEQLETAIEELNSLSRAFDIINEACQEAEEESVSFEGCSNRFFLN